MITLILVQILVATVFFEWLIRLARTLFYLHKVPGEWGALEYQFGGMVLKILGKSAVERYRIAMNLRNEYPGTVKMWNFHLFVVLTHDPDLIQKVYSASQLPMLEKPPYYDFFGFGDGLFSSRSETWRSHRRAINAAFSLRNLESFLPIFDDCSRKLVQKLKRHVDGESFEIDKYLVQNTLQTTCRTSFNVDVEEREEDLKTFNRHLQTIDDLTATRVYNMHLHPNFIYRQTSFYQEDRVAHKFCHDFGDELVKKRRQELTSLRLAQEMNNNETEEDDGYNKRKKPAIFVDQLINLGENGRKKTSFAFTDDQVRDQTLTLLNGGNQTTTNAVSMCLIYLAIHPDCQSRALREIVRVMDGSEEITCEKLRQMTYLDMVIKETLRLCPSVPIIAREVGADTKVDNVFFPKGVHIVVPLMTLHRHPQYWGPDADKFNPDNFLPENVAQRPAFAYMPFAAGVRNCIGYKYALFSMKSMLIHLLQAYEFFCPFAMEDLEYFSNALILAITNGYFVRIKERRP